MDTQIFVYYVYFVVLSDIGANWIKSKQSQGFPSMALRPSCSSMSRFITHTWRHRAALRRRPQKRGGFHRAPGGTLAIVPPLCR